MSVTTGWTAGQDLLAAGRDTGLLGVLREGLPTWVIEGFAILTHLGDTWLLAGFAAVLYLAYDRRAGGFVTGTLLVGLAATVALKAWFALPRPPEELAHALAGGFGFPSGHAIGATVTWGAAAVALARVSTPRRRALVAGVVVGVVALSRVVIGVHYFVDVVAGVGVGLIVLAVAVRWGRDAPVGLFGLAVAVALAAVVVSGGTWQAVALLGAGVGAIAGWQLAEPADRPWGRHGVAAIGGVGVVVAGSAAVIDPATALVFGAAAMVTTAIFVGPVARERWLDRAVARGRAGG